MLEVFADYRIGGEPRYYVADNKDVLMQVPDEVRKCVLFICCQSPDRLELLGTAFLVAEPIENTDYIFPYIVTAKHLIEDVRRYGIDEKVYLRVNQRDGNFRFIATDIKSWIFHPDDPFVDVAVLPLVLPAELDYRAFPIAGAVTKGRIPNLGIGVGDEIFLVGLFIYHAGTGKNIPIIRVGNIAAMPEEPVQTAKGLMDAYLIEVRSIGGLSGSPVFVHLPPVRFHEDRPKFLQRDYFYLLGLIYGHYWDLPESASDATLGEDALKETINTGIAIVIPASKIIEIINQPELNQLKEKRREEIIKQTLPVEDTNRRPT